MFINLIFQKINKILIRMKINKKINKNFEFMDSFVGVCCRFLY